MIHGQHFIDYVLEPTLKEIEMYSIEAMLLMYATAYTESRLTHLKQLNGPALGIFQVEPKTYLDVKRYLETRPDIETKVLAALEYDSIPNSSMHLISNLKLSTIIARIKYWMHPSSIPERHENAEMYSYYKHLYNCNPIVDSQEVFFFAMREARKWISLKS